MRTYEEISEELDKAIGTVNLESVEVLCTELEALAEPMAMASVANARGGLALGRGEYAAALALFEKALAFAIECGNQVATGNFYGNIALVHINLGDYAKAIECFDMALSLHEPLQLKGSIARANGNMGILYELIGDYPKSLECSEKARAMFNELGAIIGESRAIGQMGNLYTLIGDYPRALEHLEQARAIQLEHNDIADAAVVDGNIGIVYQNLGEYSKSLEHFERSIAMCESVGDRPGAARIISNIGTVYEHMGDIAKALVYQKKALALLEEIGDRVSVARISVSIGIIHASLDSWDEVTNVLKRLDTMIIDDPTVIVQWEMLKARVYEHDNDADRSVAAFHNALSLAEEHSLKSMQAEIQKALRDSAKKHGDFEAYVHHNDEYQRITEQINGKETATKLAMQEAERNMAKERERERTERELIAKEREREQAILYSTLPKHIADRVSGGEKVNDHYENSAVIFIDVVGFTTLSSQLNSSQVVEMLESLFTAVDDVCAKNNAVKIKTIGDSYMAVAFPTVAHLTES